ncbi:phosphodiester glycosidase family protein [Pseudactinotalea sp. Z1748]|uniref:phosphodiester glycosidase family protein n=1 Tax=Pseudactinotalea sp. Z1748 TaxID=3413027 RepID=UPI003C7DB26A
MIAATVALLVAPTLIGVAPQATEVSNGWEGPLPAPIRPDIPPGIEAYGGELPLGSPSLTEEREVVDLAPGVTYTAVTRGEADGVYTVNVLFTTDQAEARELSRDLTADGYRNRVERIVREIPDDPSSTSPVGWVVRTGNFASTEAAAELQDVLESDGHPRGAVRHTGEDGFRTSGPWVVNILEIDPTEFNGTVEPVLANGMIPGLATVPETAVEHEALAAVNGGFFWVAGEDGVDGQIAGLAMTDGDLVSGQAQVSPNTDFVDFRSALLFQPGTDMVASVDSVGAELTATSGAVSAHVHGLNRIPLDKELVHLTPAFGPDTAPAAATEPGTGIEVALDEDGVVSEVREERGGAIPADGSVLVGIGSGAEWLAEHAAVGQALAVDHHVTTAIGEALSDEVTGLVNGGPRLVTDGQKDLQPWADGFAGSADFFFSWSISRHPRTVAGIAEDGTVFFVTIDGRQPGVSAGASIWEAARVALSLDAEHAVNLDGGGSTTMVIDDVLVTNQPLRAIADAIVIVPQE